jgi:hypothetical protein
VVDRNACFAAAADPWHLVAWVPAPPRVAPAIGASHGGGGGGGGGGSPGDAAHQGPGRDPPPYSPGCDGGPKTSGLSGRGFVSSAPGGGGPVTLASLARVAASAAASAKAKATVAAARGAVFAGHAASAAGAAALAAERNLFSSQGSHGPHQQPGASPSPSAEHSLASTVAGRHPNACEAAHGILDHDLVVWAGDLNYGLDTSADAYECLDALGLPLFAVCTSNLLVCLLLIGLGMSASTPWPSLPGERPTPRRRP